MSRVAYWFAVAWTVGVTLYLAFVPIYGTRMSWTETARSGRSFQVTEPGSQTLIDVNGSRALVLLAIPLILVALPAAARKPQLRKRIGIACAIALFILAFLGSASIGMFYYPSAIGLLLAATTIRPSPKPL